MRKNTITIHEHLYPPYGGSASGSRNNRPKPKRRPIDKATRNAVWIKYVGNKVEGKCYCCRIRTIHITDFQVGHNKAVAKGGDDNVSNLRPICGPCNHSMGKMSIEHYKSKYFGKKTSKAKKKNVKKRKTKSYPSDPFRLPDVRLPKIR